MSSELAQYSLFGAEQPTRRRTLAGGGWMEHHTWLSPAAADALFIAVRKGMSWEQHEWDGMPMPRLEALCGAPGLSYTYSGRNTYNTKGWLPELRVVAQQLSEEQGVEFNAAFCNRYRTGQDSIGWHSDYERNLGPKWPTDIRIASLSLGATRRFRLKPMEGFRTGYAEPFGMDLEHGDLVIMGGPLQQDWKHAAPKTAKPVGERINITFRVLRGSDAE